MTRCDTDPKTIFYITSQIAYIPSCVIRHSIINSMADAFH